jgi:hypothetical protein
MNGDEFEGALPTLEVTIQKGLEAGTMHWELP